MDADPWVLVLAGDSLAGKTQLRGHITNSFPEYHCYGADTRDGDFVIGVQDQREAHCSLKLKVWDLAGTLSPALGIQMYCQPEEPLIVVLVYDVNNVSSFGAVFAWWSDLQRFDLPADTHIVAIGNKADLLDGGASLTTDEGMLPPDAVAGSTTAVQTAAAFCEKEQIPHYVVSAKTGAGVQEALQAAVVGSRRRHNRPVHGLRGGARLPLAPLREGR